jgi:hypothetical protein
MQLSLINIVGDTESAFFIDDHIIAVDSKESPLDVRDIAERTAAVLKLSLY